jgi:hypothetical protein
MLLLVTNRGDFTADWLVLELQRRDVAYVRLNTEDFPDQCDFRWTPTAARLQVRGVTIESSQITSVWFRRPVGPQLRPGLGDEEARWASREAAAALDGFWRTLEADWVSKPAAIRLAESKPHQLVNAASAGFDIPDTMITKNPADVWELWERSPSGVVCKPLQDGQVRTAGSCVFYTSRLERDHIDQLAHEPYLFQSLVPKRYDVRVTVIGTHVFAARIESQRHPSTSVDWRRGSPGTLHYGVEDLPVALSAACRQLVSGYGLQFGAIDLARRRDGGYTFFEINPNGQWAFVEQRTGLPLRRHLADLLLCHE